MAKAITFDEFLKKYKPVINKLNEYAGYDGYMYETFGAEFDRIKDPEKGEHVWTLITGDGDEDCIVPGFHFVNRLGYFLTTVSAEDDDMYVEWE